MTLWAWHLARVPYYIPTSVRSCNMPIVRTNQPPNAQGPRFRPASALSASGAEGFAVQEANQGVENGAGIGAGNGKLHQDHMAIGFQTSRNKAIHCRHTAEKALVAKSLTIGGFCGCCMRFCRQVRLPSSYL